MALFPTRQTITVDRPAGGSLDIWGNPSGQAQTFNYKCRVVEGSAVTNDQGADHTGKVVVRTAVIKLDGLVDIQFTDTITFTNEVGVTIERKPLNIKVMRGFSGKPMLTEVEI